VSKGAKRTLDRALFGTLRPIKIPINHLVTVADGAPGAGTVVLRKLPQGNLLFFGAVAYIKFTNVASNLIATFAGDFSIGTTPDANGALATTDVDLIASTELLAADGVTARHRAVTTNTSGVIASPVLFDNTDRSLEANLNVLIDDASISGAASLRATGMLFLALMKLGDD
jgi:hypothetical protein